MAPVSSKGPVLTRRRLRNELRRLREDMGLSLDQVAREMVWSVSKIVRIENGSVGISVNDAKALIDLYGPAASGLSDELLDLAKDSRRRMWWGQYREKLAPGFLEMIGLEEDASRILNFQPFLVPGLLQTEEYARAVVENEPIEPVELAEPVQVEVRMERQRRILRRTSPPEYVAILDESVLYRRFGGGTVLRDQLNALLDFAREDHISIVIVPTDVQVHPGVAVGFVILEFADPKDNPVVFHDQYGSELAADSPDEIERYAQRFQRLSAFSVRDSDAIALIKKARDRSS
jgi:transcriptional regulator with XRE-family HTH domain